MQKVEHVSCILYVVFKAICWLLPTITVYFFLFHLDTLQAWGVLSFLTSSSKSYYTAHFTMLHKFVVLLIQVLPVTFIVIICSRLAALFHLFEKGRVFEEQNLDLINQIALAMIVSQLVQLLYQPLLTVALSCKPYYGGRFMTVSLGSANISTMLTGSIILLTTWIIKEAVPRYSKNSVPF